MSLKALIPKSACSCYNDSHGLNLVGFGHSFRMDGLGLFYMYRFSSFKFFHKFLSSLMSKCHMETHFLDRIFLFSAGKQSSVQFSGTWFPISGCLFLARPWTAPWQTLFWVVTAPHPPARASLWRSQVPTRRSTWNRRWKWSRRLRMSSSFQVIEALCSRAHLKLLGLK